MTRRKRHLGAPDMFMAFAFVITITLAILTVTDVVAFWVFAIATAIIFIVNLIRYWDAERATRGSGEHDR